MIALVAVLVASLLARGAPVQPGFETALADARRANKPLVIEVGSPGCEPCKKLSAELRAAKARPEVSAVHFVDWEMDVDEWHRQSERFRVQANPTLIAFGPQGNELDRRLGYDGDIEPVLDWLRAVPHHLLPLDQTLSQADDDPTDAELQLIAARRLIAAHQANRSATYLARAAHSSRPEVAATAIWEVALLGQASARRPAAEDVLTRYPESRAALAALEFVLDRPSPPQPLITRAIEIQMRLERNRGSGLDRLLWMSLRAGSPDLAEAVLKRFQATLSPNMKAMYTLELHLARGEMAGARQHFERLDGLAQRLYPATLRSFDARIRRGQPSVASKPLVVRLREDAEAARAALPRPQVRPR
jgi:hypothetical protein